MSGKIHPDAAEKQFKFKTVIPVSTTDQMEGCVVLYDLRYNRRNVSDAPLEVTALLSSLSNGTISSKNAGITCLTDVSRSTCDQPERIVIKAGTDIGITFLC